MKYADAAHLFRRMGFNAPPGDINTAVLGSREQLINRLLNYQKNNNGPLDSLLARDFSFLQAKTENDLNDQNFNETEIRQWWISRLLNSARPFEEKMTLFWHNFFATSLDKVSPLFMYLQNLDLRRLALARFDNLLLQVAQGPAMLVWLDGVTSTQADPNENFGRELQELFSMGTHDVVTGEANYTEQDVKEVARAFTGWRFRKSADKSPFAYEWFLDETQADARAKTIYGQSGNFSGQDVISMITARRATGRYLIKRLFEFFVYPLDSDSAADRATIEKFADVYFASDHSIKAVMQAIFTSDEFFSERAYFGLVKNPVEFIIGAMKLIGVDFAFGSPGKRDSSIEMRLRAMGMDLFRPPNVFGWKLNLGFINNDAILERYNFADYLIFGSRTMATEPGLIQPLIPIRPKLKKTVAGVMAPFAQLGLAPEVVQRLQTYLVTDPQGRIVAWDGSDRFNAVLKTGSMQRLIMCLPEFQLN